MEGLAHEHTFIVLPSGKVNRLDAAPSALELQYLILGLVRLHQVPACRTEKHPMLLKKLCGLLNAIRLRLPVVGVLVLVVGKLRIVGGVALEVVVVLFEHGENGWVLGNIIICFNVWVRPFINCLIVYLRIWAFGKGTFYLQLQIIR